MTIITCSNVGTGGFWLCASVVPKKTKNATVFTRDFISDSSQSRARTWVGLRGTHPSFAFCRSHPQWGRMLADEQIKIRKDFNLLQNGTSLTSSLRLAPVTLASESPPPPGAPDQSPRLFQPSPPNRNWQSQSGQTAGVRSPTAARLPSTPDPTASSA